MYKPPELADFRSRHCVFLSEPIKMLFTNIIDGKFKLSVPYTVSCLLKKIILIECGFQFCIHFF